MNKPQVDMEAFAKEAEITTNQFIDAIEGLSKNQIMRVTKALAMYPVNHEKVKLSHPEEIIAFDLGEKLFVAKMNMTITYLGEHSRKGTEMINEAEGNTPEEKVENAMKTAKGVNEIDEMKAQIVEEVPEVIKEVVKEKPKRKPRKKAVKKVKKDE